MYKITIEADIWIDDKDGELSSNLYERGLKCQAKHLLDSMQRQGNDAIVFFETNWQFDC